MIFDLSHQLRKQRAVRAPVGASGTGPHALTAGTNARARACDDDGPTFMTLPDETGQRPAISEGSDTSPYGKRAESSAPTPEAQVLRRGGRQPVGNERRSNAKDTSPPRDENAAVARPGSRTWPAMCRTPPTGAPTDERRHRPRRCRKPPGTLRQGDRGVSQSGREKDSTRSVQKNVPNHTEHGAAIRTPQCGRNSQTAAPVCVNRKEAPNRARWR